MKVKEFNPANLRELRTELNAQMAKIEKKFGIKIEVGNMSYRSSEVSIKVKANTISATGIANSKEAEQFSSYASRGGFSHFKVGDKVEIKGHILTIKGYNTRAPKAPIQLEANGKSYKCPATTLINKQPIK
jgi:hypothetical protein